MKLQPYPKYKPTGIEWLDDIPEGWEVKRVKRIFFTLNGATPKSSVPDNWNGDITWVTPEDLGKLGDKMVSSTRRNISQKGYDDCGTSLAPKGSLVLSTRAPIGHLAIAGKPLCTNQGCRCLVIRLNADSTFFYFQLLAAKQELESLGEGTTFKELNRDRLTAVFLVSPSIHEQKAIATFLDRETGRIDSLIEKKQEQIELLAEKRSALISHAVTKGLDPNVKMKPTGIEWLGDIPEHWEVKRLRFLSKVNPVKSDVSGLLPHTEVSFVPMEAISESGGLRLDTIKAIGDVYQGFTYFRDGDVLTAKITPCFENGKGGIAEGLMNGVGFGTTELHVVRPGPKLDRLFFFFLTISIPFRQSGEAEMYGAGGQKRVPDSFFRNYRTPLPNIIEQRTIAAFLDRKTAKIDSLNDKIKASIKTLREYRSAIITAAVTGKIDVREA